jgi:hypothetical protein
MKLESSSIPHGGRIPEQFAFGAYDPETHIRLSGNRNPELSFTDLPSGARSLALICHDVDVPSRGDDVNQEGRTVPASLPRVDFYHWVLLDIPPSRTGIAAGELSDGVTARGKPGPQAKDGMRQGLNDYTGWFADDPDMAGDYYGYDGPCPPFNDEIVHHYHFTLYALDVERLPLEGELRGPDVLRALEGHVLDRAAIEGVYAINPNAR